MRTLIGALGRSSCETFVEMRIDGELYAEGSAKVVWMNTLSGKSVPLPDDVLAYHKEKIAERAKAENRAPVFQMVVDDIYAISKSKLIGRPR